MTKIDRFFALWALVLPITSILVFPSVQGTTPAYLLAFCSLPLVALFRPHRLSVLLRSLIVIIAIFAALTILSQLSLLAFPNLDLRGLQLVNTQDGRLVLRSSLFTQSVYLLAGMLTFVFVKTFYTPSWDKYIFGGALLLALYGVYEFSYYLIFSQNGDFLSNRVFQTGTSSSQGSLFQTFTAGGISFLRLKSLTGEPSMYAFTILPFWIFAIHKRKVVVHSLLLLTLILTTSTTALLGIALYFLCRLWFTAALLKSLQGRLDALLAAFVLLLLSVSVFAWSYVADLINEMVIAKLTLANTSGTDRFGSFMTSFRYFLDAPLPNQMFGIGFGYIRSSDFLTTLLVNTGVVGVLLFSLLFLYPFVKLNNDYLSTGLKVILLVIFTTMMVAVSEFAYLSIWLFLGIAYNLLERQRAKRKHLHYGHLH